MSAAIHSKIKEGSVLGGILLIAGSCIGAGMLALPIVTGIGGFLPSLAMFLFAWIFMTSTGFLLLEANLRLGYQLSLISLAEKTLGPIGKFFCWILFIFLFYSLSIAYIAASGSLLETIGVDFFGVNIPSWFGSLLFTSIFGVVLMVGTRSVDYLNRLLMIGLFLTYGLLVFLGMEHVNPDYLLTHHWKYAFAAIPILVISFGFHNMIPSLAMYLKGDVKRLRITVLIGSVIPLIFYLIWELVMLGIIPLHGMEGLFHALDQGQAATEVLRSVVGRSWISGTAQSFALFSIITSFLAQSLSLVDFLADGLKIAKIGMGRLFLVLMTLVPPFIFAFIYPGIFIRALNIAGGFSAVILFGVMPALMVWILRYRREGHRYFLLPFGRPFLISIFIAAIGIFLFELAQELGLSLIPADLEALGL